MEILKKKFKKNTKPKNLWKEVDEDEYQDHVTIGPTTEQEEIDEKVVYMEDLEKRKEAYGICGECNEPGTGSYWCKPCNAKRFKENFKNWTSGNKDIDELIQHSQLNAVHFSKYLEWIPFESFENITYITRGGFGKIYSAKWAEGYIYSWDIKNQMWKRNSNVKVALKSLDNSFDISTDFLNEIKSHLQIYLWNVVQCYGITQDPDTKDYMMVLRYCRNGNLRNSLNESIDYETKIDMLYNIASGLLNIHDSEKVHKDFHSGNVLFIGHHSFISDLGMCQSANNKEKSAKKEGVYGVLPYMAPEVLCGYQYTKAADIYSFGIIMNEFLSEETPYNDIPHDHMLAIKICKGLRPKISEDTPKLLEDLIMKCWDAKSENRPTAKELHQILNKWNIECGEDGRRIKITNSEIYIQIRECEKIKENKLKNRSDKNKSKNIQTHPQAIYTSRLLNFKNLPEPVNSTDLSSFQTNSDTLQSTSANPISECFDCQLDESDLNEINLNDEDDE